MGVFEGENFNADNENQRLLKPSDVSFHACSLSLTLSSFYSIFLYASACSVAIRVALLLLFLSPFL